MTHSSFFNPVYAAMVESLDQSLGRLQDFLNETGLAKNTILIFYSDNGGYALATSNEPPRGSKGNLYEGGIRVPMIVKWPQVITGGRETDVVVSGVDLFPTFKELLEGATPVEALDGESLVSLWKSEPHDLHERPIFWYEPVYLDSYDSARYERDKITHLIELTSYGRIKQKRSVEALPGEAYPAWRLVPAACVRKGDYKLIRYLEYDSLELYNLKEDPSESVNLVGSRPGIVQDLTKALSQWATQTGASLALKPNPSFDPKSTRNYKTGEKVKTGTTKKK